MSTASASEFVGGLDRFLEPNKPTGNRHRLRYALLCEFGHPNLRGLKGLSHLVRETEDGWLVQYTAEEDGGAYGVQMIVEYLLEDMRLGYAASEFLRPTTFVDDGDRFAVLPSRPEGCGLDRERTHAAYRSGLHPSSRRHLAGKRPSR